MKKAAGRKQKLNNVSKRSNKAASELLHLKGAVFNMAKIGTQKKITVEGTEYTLQFPGHRVAAQITDRVMTAEGKFSTEKFNEELFQHVIVDPKVSWDYFDENEGFAEVTEAAASFLRTGKQ